MNYKLHYHLFSNYRILKFPNWILLLVSCFLNLSETYAQGGTWVWVNGSSEGNATAVYGTKGVASVNNNPPALYQGVQWNDKQGNFWIFGGSDINGYMYNNLWEYNPLANTWTWVNGPGDSNGGAVYGTLGVPAGNNIPGARMYGSASWTDSTGDLWLFAGLGYDADYDDGELNDLWKYHIATGEWTWMGGPSLSGQPGVYGTLHQASPTSVPTGRNEINAAWIDANNNLWLFGGSGTLGYFNDIWSYNIAGGEWAWMGGSNAVNAAVNYGTLNVENASNVPGARECFTHWIDGNYLYLTGGLYLNEPDYGVYNDVWRFNITTNNWAWVGGDAGVAPTGQYDNYCTLSNNNAPMGRYEQRTVQSSGCSHILYMWGGRNVNNDNWSMLNDLWSFDITSGEWRWISGNDNLNAAGNFGTMGVPSPSNLPAGADGMCLWCDNSGQLWLWGGWTGYSAELNFSDAMWKFVPDNTCVPVDTGSSDLVYSLSSPSVCSGDSVMLILSGDTEVSISPNTNVRWIDSLHAELKPDSTTLFTISGNSPCGGLNSQTFTLAVTTDTFNFSVNKTAMCCGDSALLSFSGDTGISISPNTDVSWIDSADASVKPLTSTAYTISGYSNCGVLHSQTFTLLVTSDSLSFTSSKTSICNGDSAMLSFAGDSALSISPDNNVTWIDSLHAVLYPDTSTLFIISGYSACGLVEDAFNLVVTNDSVSISSNKQSMCPGDTAQICATPGFAGYSWNTGDTSSCINTTSAGNYYVTATGNGNCRATSNHLSIHVYQPASVSISVTGDTLTGYNAFSYQWFLNNTAIQGATDSVYITKTGGMYSLQITDSNGCISTSNPITITGINNELAETSITVFPNPTSTGWQLNVSGEWIGSMAEVFDATGRSVFKSTITNQHSMIEITGLANGVYELLLSQPRTGNGSKTQDNMGYSAVRKLIKM